MAQPVWRRSGFARWDHDWKQTAWSSQDRHKGEGVIEVKDLALTVAKQIPGELVTNALDIQEFVSERVKEYTPEKYYDDPDAAKKDRAVLNSASKELNARRLSLEREFMRPFDEFKIIIKQTTTIIDSASAKLGEVVKAVEETIRNEKKRDIETLFAGKGFSLVPIDRIFDPRWLNATAKIKDVEAELDAKIAKVYADIEVIASLPADVAETKAQYLDTLDIGAALATAKRLRENRERLAEEERTRTDRLHTKHIIVQAQELSIDAAREAKSEPVANMAAEALGIDSDPIIEYTIRFRGTRSQLVAMRQYVTSLGIEYDKIEVDA